MMDFRDFRAAPGTAWSLEDGVLQLQAPPRSDLIVDAAGGAVRADSAFLYREVEGDFVLQARVSQPFRSTYDAPALLAMDHETLWAKACLEYTDLGTRAVVSVFTNGRSDDCNGVETAGDWARLQLSRRGDVFAVHYAFDDGPWKMHRIARLPMARRVKVGFVAQSPLGEGGRFLFRQAALRLETLADQRGGNR